MRYPLDSAIVVPNGNFGVVAVAGTGLPDRQGVNRHIGVDLRASVGTKIYAPSDGIVTLVDNVGLKLLELRIGDFTHRFLHLDRNILGVGANVKKGQHIGYSGNSGGVLAHLHWDVRKAGTAWNHAFSDYVDPLSLIKGGSMGDFSQEANDRQNALIQIAKEVSVDYKDLNDVIKVITNIRTMGARIDELTRIVGELENKPAPKAKVLDKGLYEVK